MPAPPSPILRSLWYKIFKTAWNLGIFLIFLWGIPRFFLVLQANAGGNYQPVSLIFLSMWLTPWLFLTRAGRSQMGWKRPKKPAWLPLVFILGAMSCAALFVIFDGAYGNALDNAFVYISRSYKDLPATMSGTERRTYFLIYAGVSMIFSPIGEELFFRGLIHECLATRWGDRGAAYADSAAFALTHLAHFGIVYQAGAWELLPLPATIWVGGLWACCLMFSWSRRKTGSIWGAILAHAGFNLGMIYLIFYQVL